MHFVRMDRFPNDLQITPETVDKMIGGIHALSDYFRAAVCIALSKLPIDVIDFATEKIFWISSDEQRYAFVMNRDKYNDRKWFVVLSETMKELSDMVQWFFIAHEVAHCWLDHKNPIFDKLSKDEVARQENEADEQVAKWINA
jgi:hypothetical protein